LIHALHTWHNIACIETIYHSWKAGGRQIRGPLSERATPQLNATKIAQIIRENCADTPATPETDARD
jgi:hypothetical protein